MAKFFFPAFRGLEKGIESDFFRLVILWPYFMPKLDKFFKFRTLKIHRPWTRKTLQFPYKIGTHQQITPNFSSTTTRVAPKSPNLLFPSKLKPKFKKKYDIFQWTIFRVKNYDFMCMFFDDNLWCQTVITINYKTKFNL